MSGEREAVECVDYLETLIGRLLKGKPVRDLAEAIGAIRGQIRQAEVSHQALQEENTRLRKALSPFKHLAKRYYEYAAEWKVSDLETAVCSDTTVGDFRRIHEALAALQAADPTKGEGGGRG